jgi:hypothetical protein
VAARAATSTREDNTMAKYTREEQKLHELFGTDIEKDREQAEKSRIARFYAAEKKAADKVRDER